MGADIHLQVEIRVAGKWQYVDVNVEDGRWRDYDVFARLADVRNDRQRSVSTIEKIYVPLFARRGFPEDADCRLYSTDPDDERPHPDDSHSETWAGLDELLALDWDNEPALKDSHFRRWLFAEVAPLARMVDGPENVRILMGFDN